MRRREGKGGGVGWGGGWGVAAARDLPVANLTLDLH